MYQNEPDLMAYLSGLQANSLQTPASGSSTSGYPNVMPSFNMPNNDQNQMQAVRQMTMAPQGNQMLRAVGQAELEKQRQASLAMGIGRRTPQPSMPSTFGIAPTNTSAQGNPAELATLMAFVNSQQASQQSKPVAPSMPDYGPGSTGIVAGPSVAAHQTKSSPMLNFDAQMAQRQQAAQLMQQQQRRGQTQQPGVAAVQGTPAVQILPGGYTPVQVQQPSPVLGFIRSQHAIKGLNNRIHVLEQAIRERTVIQNPDGTANGTIYDAATEKLYLGRLQADKEAAAATTESINHYIRAAGGQENVRRQIQEFVALQQQQQQQQQAIPVPLQQPQVNTAPQMAMPASVRPSTTAVRPIQPVIGPAHQQQTRLSQQHSLSPEHIAAVYNTKPLGPADFKAAFAELQLRGIVPHVAGPPVINGREISLYELMKHVLSQGGSDYIDAKQLWPSVAKVFGLFAGVQDSIVAGDIVNQLQSVYRAYMKPFEEVWVKSAMERSISQMQASMHAFQQAGPSSVGQPQQSQQATKRHLQALQQQYQASPHSQITASGAPLSFTPGGSRPNMSSMPTQVASSTQAPMQQPATLPRTNRAPTVEEVAAANQQVQRLVRQIQEERKLQPLRPVPNLQQYQKDECRASFVEAWKLVHDVHRSLATYLCIGGAAAVTDIRRYLTMILHCSDQSKVIEHDIYYFRPEQLKAMCNSFHNYIQQVTMATSNLANQPSTIADRDAYPATMKPGLRREDLKPPPSKRARNLNSADSPSDKASPGKGALTPESSTTTPPKGTSVGPSPARGRQAAARGTRGGAVARGRGAAHARGDSVSSAGPSTPLNSVMPLPIDRAEQRRLELEAAKSNPAQYAIDAFARLQNMQAETGLTFGGLTEDLGAQGSTSTTGFNIAPIVANPPQMPTLSSAAPGWPNLQPILQPTVQQSQKSDDADAFDYSLFFNLDGEIAKTPDLNGSDGSPPDEAVHTPKSIADKAAQSQRKRELSPQPIVPELGTFDWDSLAQSTDPMWEALAF